MHVGDSTSRQLHICLTSDNGQNGSAWRECSFCNTVAEAGQKLETARRSNFEACKGADRQEGSWLDEPERKAFCSTPEVRQSLLDY